MKNFNICIVLIWNVFNANASIACDGSMRTSLEENVEKWETAGWNRYSFVLERQCFCSIEFRKVMRIFVANGQVVNANYVDEEPTAVPADVVADLRTIEDWFEVIRKAKVRNAEILDVAYHSELGFPEKIEIDMRVRRADDEQTVRISRVEQE